MICVVCKKGHTRLGTATVALERENTTLVIKEVPGAGLRELRRRVRG